MKSGTAQHQEMENCGAEGSGVWGGAGPLPTGEVSVEGFCPSPDNF